MTNDAGIAEVHYAQSPHGCVAACERDSRCTHFTYVAPPNSVARDNAQGRCFLKSVFGHKEENRELQTPPNANSPTYDNVLEIPIAGVQVWAAITDTSITSAVCTFPTVPGARIPFEHNVNAEWADAPPLPMSMGEVTAGLLGDLLVVVGEVTSAEGPGDAPLGPARPIIFNVQTSKWSTTNSRGKALAAIPYPASHYAAVVLGDEFFLFGGFETNQSDCLTRGCVGQTRAYDPVNDVWRIGQQIPWNSSGSLNAGTIAGVVYVCGGLYTHGAPQNPRSCARYTPLLDAWEGVAPMPTGVDHAATGTDGSLLYIFGGRVSGVNENGPGVALLQIYNPVTDVWQYGKSSVFVGIPFHSGWI